MTKDIKGYESLYTISNDGVVRSLDRYNIDKNGKKKFYPGRELIQETSTVYGHKRVTLSKDGKTKRHLVHRLVGEAFIPNPENKPQINHIDSNPSNNHVSNLEWVTSSENMLHAQSKGRLTAAQSKGGGKHNKKKAKQRILDAIGNIYNNWQVTGFAEARKCYCKCLLCGKEYVRDFRSIALGISMQCKSCGLKRSKRGK